jgi:hypothetical protein
MAPSSLDAPQHQGRSEDAEEQKGPPLLALSIIVAVLLIGSLAVVAALTGGGHQPSPFEPASDTAGFFSRNAGAVQWSAFLQLGAAIVLGNFAAAVSSRLGFLGVRVAGVHIALFGGVGAALFALQSALLQWVLTQPDTSSDPSVVHIVHLSAFAAGAIGHVALAGLFVAGVSLSAGLSGLVPRWIMWLGLGLAVCSELATLTLLTPAAVYFLPIARFGTLFWMIAVGATLPKSRQAAQGARSARHASLRAATSH